MFYLLERWVSLDVECTLQPLSFSPATSHIYVTSPAARDPFTVILAFQIALMVYHALFYLGSEKRSWG